VCQALGVPELPEVETLLGQLVPFVGHRVLERFEVWDPRLCSPAAVEDVCRSVNMRQIRKVWRRGKYLIFELAGEVYLVMHLRMTGNLFCVPGNDVGLRAYTRARMELSGGASILFCDPRRFGTAITVVGENALQEYLSDRLGVEPLGSDFTVEALSGIVRNRRQPVKALLLSQDKIAGLGNIYADEALFRARVHPQRPAGELSRAEIERLRDGVVAALCAGITFKGASIDDFRHTDGAQGSFQDEFLVHRRAGRPCPRCRTAIAKIRCAGRGTYVCECCQPISESAATPRKCQSTGRLAQKIG
jgi:formamidopyrimidine-DNA glycosylase